MAGKVLIIATSYDGKLGDSQTGSWVEEIAAPYYVFRTNGFGVTLASVKGGAITFDPASTSGDFCTADAKQFLETEDTAALYKSTRAAADFSDAELAEYDAVFIPGGHGIMYDGDNADLQRIVEYFYTNGKVVSAVCHGPAGLLTAKDSNGNSILKDKRATGFSNAEEKAVGKDGVVPYSLEDRIKELGAAYECGPDWSEFAVTDGKIVTGQNPQSSRATARAIVELILPHLKDPVHGKGQGFHHREHPVTGEHHDHNDSKPHEHPQAHMHQWQSPVRQTTHTSGPSARSHGHPDRSYVA